MFWLIHSKSVFLSVQYVRQKVKDLEAKYEAFFVGQSVFYLITGGLIFLRSEDYLLQWTHPSLLMVWMSLERLGMYNIGTAIIILNFQLSIIYNELASSFSKPFIHRIWATTSLKSMLFGFTICSSIRKKLEWPAENLKWWLCTLLHFWNPANFKKQWFVKVLMSNA